MSKLLKLKQWLTLGDAARRLSISLSEEVTVADILQLGLDGHLKLSVNFVNQAYAARCRRVPIEEAEQISLPTPGNPTTNFNIYKGPRTDTEVFEYEEKLVKLTGVYSLPMIGAESLDVEHALQMEIGGPAVSLINLDGTFVEAQDNRYIYQVRDKRATGDGSYPSGGLPDDSILVVQTADLAKFEASIDSEDSRIEEQISLSNTERKNLLKMLGGMALLLAEKGGKYKRGNKPNTSSIADEVSELIENLPNSNLYGMSTRNIREKLSEAIRLLAES